MFKLLGLCGLFLFVFPVSAQELTRENFNLIRKQTQQSSTEIQNVIGQLNTIKSRLDKIAKEREPQANPDVSPVQPSLPATNAEGWQFDASRNVWWRLMPANTATPVNPSGRIFPSTTLPNAIPRGIIASPFRSIQNCGPSG